MSIGFRKSGRGPGFWLRTAGLGMVLVAVLAVAGWRFATRWAPSRDSYPSQGISVSAADGEIDWGSVRAQDIDFAYILATQGAGMRDAAFAGNWARARQSGLRYGAELLADSCQAATDQATLFIATVPRDNGALPPVVRLDMPSACTPSRDRIISELNTLINLVEAHSGKAALLRVSRAFEERYHVSRDINRTLWVEGDFLPPSYVDHPWVMWTANHARRIDGVDGPVEWNVVKP